MNEFGPDYWQTEQVTLALRFVDRSGRMILQQRWRITEGSHGKFGGTNVRFEWRDVPVEKEA